MELSIDAGTAERITWSALGGAFIVWCQWRGTRSQSHALAQSCDDLHDGLRRILPSCRGYCERCDSNTIPGTDNDAAFVRSTANGKTRTECNRLQANRRRVQGFAAIKSRSGYCRQDQRPAEHVS